MTVFGCGNAGSCIALSLWWRGGGVNSPPNEGFKLNRTCASEITLMYSSVFKVGRAQFVWYGLLVQQARLGKNQVSSCIPGLKPCQASMIKALEEKCSLLRHLEKHSETFVTVLVFTTYDIIIGWRCKVISALVKRASVASCTIPGTMEVKG